MSAPGMRSTQDSDLPSLEELMQMGIRAARAGNKPNARVLFQQVLDQDKENERAWLWMATVAETPMDRIRYLNTVLRINPNNQIALRELDKMRRRAATSNTLLIRYGMMGLLALLVVVACVVLLLVIQ